MNDEYVSAPPAPNQTLVLLRGLAGAAAGGIAGYFLFVLLLKNGLYSSIIPGALLGIGAGWAARGRSTILGILCAVATAPLTIVGEWSVMPFIKDKSLAFFVTHLHELPPLHLLMMALGVAAAWWFGQGR
jgi:hypothetical protein